MFVDNWKLSYSISHDPLIYIEAGWYYPSRKHSQNTFSKFSTLKKGPKLIWKPNELDSVEKLAKPVLTGPGYCGQADTRSSQLS